MMSDVISRGQMGGISDFVASRLQIYATATSALRSRDGPAGCRIVTRVRIVDFSFWPSLTRDDAIEQAVAYVESKAGPQFKTLSENEERMCARMAVSNRIQAFVFYMQARLPHELPESFLQIVTGDDLAILRFAADENISSIAEEAVAHCFYWSNSRAGGESGTVGQGRSTFCNAPFERVYVGLEATGAGGYPLISRHSATEFDFQSVDRTRLPDAHVAARGARMTLLGWPDEDTAAVPGCNVREPHCHQPRYYISCWPAVGSGAGSDPGGL
jgi:hypothetical protein